VATVSRIGKNVGLVCRILSLLQGSFAKETYNFIDPTNRSHPIARHCQRSYTRVKTTFIRHARMYIYTYVYMRIHVYIHIRMLCSAPLPQALESRANYSYTARANMYTYIYFKIHVYIYIPIGSVPPPKAPDSRGGYTCRIEVTRNGRGGKTGSVCFAACCSVLQSVAVCCSVLQCFATCSSVLQYVAV